MASHTCLEGGQAPRLSLRYFTRVRVESAACKIHYNCLSPHSDLNCWKTRDLVELSSNYSCKSLEKPLSFPSLELRSQSLIKRWLFTRNNKRLRTDREFNKNIILLETLLTAVSPRGGRTREHNRS